MKKLKTFENFKTNEWLGQEFLTGFKPGEKEIAKKRIEGEIDDAIKEYEENPDVFIKYDVNELKEKLLQKAKEDGYRGKVLIRQSRGTAYSGKYLIVYYDKPSPLQSLGATASAGAAGKAWG